MSATAGLQQYSAAESNFPRIYEVMITMTRPSTAATDPVVTYDIMREAANRLAAIHVSQVTQGGSDDPAVARAAAVFAEADEVDPADETAQRTATEDFNRRYKELSGDE